METAWIIAGILLCAVCLAIGLFLLAPRCLFCDASVWTKRSRQWHAEAKCAAVVDSMNAEYPD